MTRQDSLCVLNGRKIRLPDVLLASKWLIHFQHYPEHTTIELSLQSNASFKLFLQQALKDHRQPPVKSTVLSFDFSQGKKSSNSQQTLDTYKIERIHRIGDKSVEAA